MRFNNYIWDLYKNSEQGRKQIDEWSIFGDFPNDKFAADTEKSSIDKLREISFDKYIIDSKVNWFKILKDYYKTKEFSIDKAHEYYNKWINEGVIINEFKIVDKDDFHSWTSDISLFSEILYSLFPNYFFPYTLDCEFFKFQKICNEFDIPFEL